MRHFFGCDFTQHHIAGIIFYGKDQNDQPRFDLVKVHSTENTFYADSRAHRRGGCVFIPCRTVHICIRETEIDCYAQCDGLKVNNSAYACVLVGTGSRQELTGKEPKGNRRFPQTLRSIPGWESSRQYRTQVISRYRSRDKAKRCPLPPNRRPHPVAHSCGPVVPPHLLPAMAIHRKQLQRSCG